MTAAQVQLLFSDYADAFSVRAIDRITESWTFPAFILFSGKQIGFDRQAFYDNATRLCAFYGAQGVVRAHKEIVALYHFTTTNASVKTADKLYDATDQLIAEWEHVYLLTETADGLKIAAAIADNEVCAWRDRGTPIGGKASERDEAGGYDERAGDNVEVRHPNPVRA